MAGQAHKWRLSVLIPVTERELAQMAAGSARSFKVRIPPAVGDVVVAGYGVFCERCQIAAEAMSPQERVVCRGVDDESVDVDDDRGVV